MAKYRKKPVIIEAIQFTKAEELKSFVSNNKLVYRQSEDLFYILTLEGEHVVTINDFIIKGVKGEFYPCKPDIFEMTYELVEE